jgi:hypothetical protein
LAPLPHLAGEVVGAPVVTKEVEIREDHAPEAKDLGRIPDKNVDDDDLALDLGDLGGVVR